jgi:E3 ubiquitin-protein ligase NEDD4
VYFWSQPSMRPIADARCDVRVHSSWVFEDSLAAIMRLRSEDLRKRLVVKVKGEDALDYDGLSHEMFNPSYGLFEYSAHDIYTLQINSASGVNPEHLQVHRPRPRPRNLPPLFPRCRLCARFLNKVNLKDLEAVDYELYKGLAWMLYVLIAVVVLLADASFRQRRRDVLRDGRPLWRARRCRSQAGRRYTRRNGGEQRGTRDLLVVHRIAGRILEHALMEGLGGVLPLDLLYMTGEHDWSCSSGA